MVAVGHKRVAATLMAALAGNRNTGCRIRLAHTDDMLVIMPIVGVMQMPIVQIIDVAVVENAHVAAMLAVDMRVFCVDVMGHGV
jgi:hypothetical protein